MTLLKRYKEEPTINYQRVILKRLVCLEVEDLVDTLHSLSENILIELHNICVEHSDAGSKIILMPEMDTLFKDMSHLDFTKMLGCGFNPYDKYAVRGQYGSCLYYSFTTIYSSACPINLEKIAKHIINNPLPYGNYIHKLDCIFVNN